MLMDLFAGDASPAVEIIRSTPGELAGWATYDLPSVPKWHRGSMITIGDAAHAMSPVGGVGINIAIQDAVAAANVLRDGDFSTPALSRIQQRRLWPVRLTQRLQILAQDRIITRVLRSTGRLEPPLFFRLLNRFARLRRLPGRLIGMGLRPEHVCADQAIFHTRKTA